SHGLRSVPALTASASEASAIPSRSRSGMRASGPKRTSGSTPDQYASTSAFCVSPAVLCGIHTPQMPSQASPSAASASPSARWKSALTAHLAPQFVECLLDAPRLSLLALEERRHEVAR